MVEGAALEMLCSERGQEFESLTLRHIRKESQNLLAFFNTIMKTNQKIIYANQRDWPLTLSGIFGFFVFGSMLIHNGIHILYILFLGPLLYFCFEQFVPRKKFILYENGLWIRHYGYIPYSYIEKIKESSTSMKLHKMYSIEICFKDLSFIKNNLIFLWRKWNIKKYKTIDISVKDETEFKTVKNKLRYRIQKQA